MACGGPVGFGGAQMSVNTGQQFGQPKRFGDVINRAGVQSTHDVGFLRASCHHDDRQLRLECEQPLGDRETVGVGQAQVEQD